MNDAVRERLSDFQRSNQVTSKGKLAQVLFVSRLARDRRLPLALDIVTDGRGQVAGLGRSAVQAILADYGIERILASEGGRTSRGSLGLVRTYIELLNQLSALHSVSPEEIEAWWIERVQEFFDSKPFTLRYDTSSSLRAMVSDLLRQAEERQAENRGVRYAGTILQHLVGAKLSLITPDGTISHHGSAVADAVSARQGDFVIDDVIIHVTTAPSEALIVKCRANIESGHRPVIVTTARGMAVAEGLAENASLSGRIEVFEAEQFLSTNVYELAGFTATGRKATVLKLTERYNAIIDECETDHSLKLELG